MEAARRAGFEATSRQAASAPLLARLVRGPFLTQPKPEIDTRTDDRRSPSRSREPCADAVRVEPHVAIAVMDPAAVKIASLSFPTLKRVRVACQRAMATADRQTHCRRTTRVESVGHRRMRTVIDGFAKSSDDSTILKIERDRSRYAQMRRSPMNEAIWC